MEQDVFNAKETAAFLGVSKWSLYQLCNALKIPHRRAGRRILFSRVALLNWLAGKNDA